MLFEPSNLSEQKAKIAVVGVGGAGGNAINGMIESGLQGVEFVAVNTDAQDLKINKAKAKNIGFACIINRSNENLLIKENIISQIKLEIKTYDKNNLPEELKKINPIEPGSRNISK